MIYHNQKKYEGQWRDDKKHGKGVFTSQQGNKIYHGMWKEDKKNGSGKLIIGDEVFIQKYQRGTLVSSYNENSVSSENLFNNINEMIHSLVEKEKNSLFQELEEQKEVLENEREKLNDMKKKH